MDNPPERGMEFWSQEELLRAAHGGDTEAFKTFCVRVLPGLARYLTVQCRHHGVPVDHAIDLAQDTIVRAISQIEGRCPNESDSRPRVSVAWLQKIGYHLLIDLIRRNRRHNEALTDLSRSEVIQHSTREDEETEEILKFFGWLPDGEREILELVLLNSTPIVEAGKQMGLSKDASYKRYERAIAHLRDLVQEHGAFSKSSITS